MKVSIFGSGYVGLVIGACLADAGNHVMCVDVAIARRVESSSRLIFRPSCSPDYFN